MHVSCFSINSGRAGGVDRATWLHRFFNSNKRDAHFKNLIYFKNTFCLFEFSYIKEKDDRLYPCASCLPLDQFASSLL